MQVFGVLLISLIAFVLQVDALPILDKLYSLIQREPLCNGHAALCGRKYSEVTFIGNHNSAFVGDLPSQNQIKSVKDQLNGGIRFLQSQTHKFDIGDLDVMAMCHTNCALAFGGLVDDFLKTVKEFMDKNPREVVTLLLTNPDNAPMSTFDGIYKRVGLDKMSFVPAGSPNTLPMDQWPTLGEMIEKNQRLVTYIGKLDLIFDNLELQLTTGPDYGADAKSVPYLLDQFNYYWESPFNTLDPKFNQCKIDRKNKLDASGKSSMNLVNHYLDVKIPFTDITIPDRQKLDKTNAMTGEGSLGAHADLCRSQHGRNPNVLLINFFGKGDAIGAQKRINGL